MTRSEILEKVLSLKKNHYFFVRESEDISKDLQKNITTHAFTASKSENIDEYWECFLEKIKEYHEIEEFNEEDLAVLDELEITKIEENSYSIFAHNGIAVTSIENEKDMLEAIENENIEEFVKLNSWNYNGQNNYYSINSKKTILIASFGDFHLLASPEADEQEALPNWIIECFE